MSWCPLSTTVDHWYKDCRSNIVLSTTCGVLFLDPVVNTGERSPQEYNLCGALTRPCYKPSWTFSMSRIGYFASHHTKNPLTLNYYLWILCTSSLYLTLFWLLTLRLFSIYVTAPEWYRDIWALGTLVIILCPEWVPWRTDFSSHRMRSF